MRRDHVEGTMLYPPPLEPGISRPAGASTSRPSTDHEQKERRDDPGNDEGRGRGPLRGDLLDQGRREARQHGSKGSTVFRDPNEDDRVWVLFDWDGEGWKSFVSDPDVPAILQVAGHVGQAPGGGARRPVRRLGSSGPETLDTIVAAAMATAWRQRPRDCLI